MELKVKQATPKLETVEEKYNDGNWKIPFKSVVTDFNLIKDLPKIVAIDTETTGLNWAKDDSLFAISAAWYDSQDKLQTAYWCWPVNPYSRSPIYRR